MDRDDLFVALIGEHHDAHRFIPQMIRQGRRGFMVCETHCQAGSKMFADIQNTLEKSGTDRDISMIAVPDTVIALGDMARHQRRQADVSVIAVTGSNGKTTTREMTAAVMRQRFRTLATKGNFNNHIGMPLTLLQLHPEHEWAVLELGMNHPGEIRTLGDICLPDIGIITNVADAHIEGLGSIEGVARAKGELLETIRPGGTAIVNGEDPHVRQLASQPVLKDRLRQVLHFGFGKDMDIRAHSLHPAETGTRFTLQLPDEQLDIHLRLPGRFMVLNALAAAAAGYVCGVSAPDIKIGLEQFAGVPGRMHILEIPRGIHIIDDTYNANPGSMQAAITALTTLKQQHNGFLVVGDMYELGHQAAKQHARTGQLAALHGVSGLFATGRFAEEVAEGARKAGLSAERIFTGSKDTITERLIHHLKSDDWVLIKGSRAMAMETMVQDLIRHYE
jgi:UDP-N-acetylmuramoyl-tripeptide--D-alanyl-D-alanine ligase